MACPVGWQRGRGIQSIRRRGWHLLPMHAPSALRGIVAGRTNMTAGKAVVRRAAAAALAPVLALAVVGPVAAGPRGDRTPPTTPTNLRVTSLSHKSVTLAWDPSTDNSG